MKYRIGFVTNSSSSSFILAFNNKKDAYAALCEAFLEEYHSDDEYNQEKDYTEGYYSFDEYKCALDNLVIMLIDGVLTKEAAIEKYLNDISYYPVRYEIREKLYADVENYPRENAQDFNNRYKELIDTLHEAQMSDIRAKMEKWLKNKKLISLIEIESHYPESQAYEVLKRIKKKNKVVIDP